MKIDGLLYSEIQQIKRAVEKNKEEIWIGYAKLFRKDLTFKEIKEAKRTFDGDINEFKEEGRCNRILLYINKIEEDIIKKFEGLQK